MFIFRSCTAILNQQQIDSRYNCTVNLTGQQTGILRVIFSEYRESEDTHEKSVFLLFHQNISLGELIRGKIV